MSDYHRDFAAAVQHVDGDVVAVAAQVDVGSGVTETQLTDLLCIALAAAVMSLAITAAAIWGSIELSAV